MRLRIVIEGKAFGFLPVRLTPIDDIPWKGGPLRRGRPLRIGTFKGEIFVETYTPKEPEA